MTVDDGKFIGTWKLVSVETRSGDQITYPIGEDPIGFIMYNTDGYMSVAFMPSNRPKFSSEDPMKGTVEEKVAAFESFCAYCGKYEVIGNKIVHHVEVSSVPTWTGEEFERVYKFEGDKLMLKTTPTLVDGEEHIYYLLWKRV